MAFPRISDVKDGRGLAQWGAAVEDALAKLATMQGGAYVRAASNADYRAIGEFTKALCLGDHQKVKDLGGEPTPASDYAVKNTLTSDSLSGSYLVPIGFRREVERVAEETSVLLPLVTRQEMLTRTMSIPYEVQAPRMVWVASQLTAITEASSTFNSVTLQAYTCASYQPLSLSELEDEDVGLVGRYLSTAFGESLGNEIDEQILAGTGVPCTGLATLSGVNEYTLGAGKTTLSSIALSDLLDLIAELGELRYRRGGRFIMSVGAMDAMRKIQDDFGRSILTPETASSPGSIWGYPAQPCDQMTSTPAPGEIAMHFGNFARVIMGNRISLDVSLFDKTQAAVTSDLVYVRARARIGFSFPLPGAFSRMKLATA